MSRRSIRLLVGVVISLIAIYFCAVGVDYTSVWGYLRQANLVLIGLAIASVGLNNVAKAMRWKLLLGERGATVSLWHLLQLHLVAQMLNQILPTRVGDISRIYLAGDLGLSRSFVLGTVALEKIIDMACYALIFALLLVMIPLPAWVRQPTYALALAALAALCGLGVLFLFRQRFSGLPQWIARWAPARLRDRVETIIGAALESLHVLADRRFGVRMTLLSTLIWITAALANYFVLWALHIDAPPVSGLFVLFVLLAGINISSVPGQIGVFEYLCVLSLGVFGVDQARAISFGVLLHVITYLPPLVAGVLAMWGAGPAARSLRREVSEAPRG
ncbi:MAG: lysylphosphatidylglycerol synthase transmembrane domain-containing protein [Chloroflexales bacterium]